MLSVININQAPRKMSTRITIIFGLKLTIMSYMLGKIGSYNKNGLLHICRLQPDDPLAILEIIDGFLF